MITTRRITRIYECTYKVYTFYYMWHWGEILVHIKMHLCCYQKVATRSRSVSVHLDLSYDAFTSPTRFVGNIRVTRPISHEICRGEILVHIKMHLCCYQKVATRSRSVSVHLDLSYDAFTSPTRFVENIRATRPLSREICRMVLWPKFGHSTTLNNKGYRAHKVMGSVS